MKLVTVTTCDGRTMLRCYTQGALAGEKELTPAEVTRMIRELAASLQP